MSNMKDEIVVDMSTDDPVTTTKPRVHLKKVRFTPETMGEMLLSFAAAKPNENICWLTGVVKGDIGYVFKCWQTNLSHKDVVSAKTDTRWMHEFSQTLAQDHPTHNLVIEAHIHPIGSSMSGTDQEGLYAITSWSDEIYFCMIACDIPLGVYTIQNQSMQKVNWEVIPSWQKEKRESVIQTNSSISSPSWVRRIMGRLRK